MKSMIEVHQLSKEFRRHSTAQGYKTLRETLSRPFKSDTSLPVPSFKALDDISFNVATGDVVGLIGRNGAGKSTLLKIISHITSPSSGSITLRGRVGSLLEVGTGFHPELTGRENVFMNGAILGMKRREILQKFDEIVTFADLADFIDTPVKRYSSGMSMRLAFAVAAHLEPEILIIDEVLAVGDVRFQKKCLGKISDISKQGRTVLFVSHNMTAIRNLCNRCILLDHGRLVLDDPTTEKAIDQYLHHNQDQLSSLWKNDGSVLAHDPIMTPHRLSLSKADGSDVQGPVPSDQALTIAIDFDMKKKIPGLAIGFALTDQSGQVVFQTFSTDSIDHDSHLYSLGRNRLQAALPANILNDGDYTLSMVAGVYNDRPILWLENNQVAIRLSIAGNNLRSTYWSERRPTSIAPVIEWSHQHVG